jgi:hypothetical protein
VSFFTMLVYLIALHALCDFPLQGDFMAKAKNQYAPLPGVPPRAVLMLHATIHAGAVLLVTGSHAAAAAEFVIHTITDDYKCEGRISFATDQAIHVGCKVAFAALCFGATP